MDVCPFSYSLPAFRLTKEPTEDEVVVTTDRTDVTGIQHLSHRNPAGSLEDGELARIAVVDGLGPVDSLELALRGLITGHHAAGITAIERDAERDEEEGEECECQHSGFGTRDGKFCVRSRW